MCVLNSSVHKLESVDICGQQNETPLSQWIYKRIRPNLILRLKSHEILFAHMAYFSIVHLFLNCAQSIVSDRIVLYAKFEKDWTIDTNAIAERDLV